MTTMDVPTVGQFVALQVAKFVAKREKRANSTAPAWFQSVIRLVLHLIGFSCLTYAGFIWHPAAGFVAAGISCFLLSWLTTGNGTPAAPKAQPDPLMYGRK